MNFVFDPTKMRYWREKRVLSQREFAALLGKATDRDAKYLRDTVSSWERGEFSPNQRNIRDVATALDITADQLLSTAAERDKNWQAYLDYTKAVVAAREEKKARAAVKAKRVKEGGLW